MYIPYVPNRVSPSCKFGSTKWVANDRKKAVHDLLSPPPPEKSIARFGPHMFVFALLALWQGGDIFKNQVAAVKLISSNEISWADFTCEGNFFRKLDVVYKLSSSLEDGETLN